MTERAELRDLAELLLVARLHVDLLRVASAGCRDSR
ncbi:MAG: putative leader peptide [Frankia sp.]